MKKLTISLLTAFVAFVSHLNAQSITNTNAILVSVSGFSNLLKLNLNSTQFNSGTLPATISNVYPALLTSTNPLISGTNMYFQFDGTNFYWSTNALQTNLQVILPGPGFTTFKTQTLVIVNGVIRAIQ